MAQDRKELIARLKQLKVSGGDLESILLWYDAIHKHVVAPSELYTQLENALNRAGVY